MLLGIEGDLVELAAAVEMKNNRIGVRLFVVKSLFLLAPLQQLLRPVQVVAYLNAPIDGDAEVGVFGGIDLERFDLVIVAAGKHTAVVAVPH